MKEARVWASSKNIDHVWEIENNSAGVKELETLISDAIEARVKGTNISYPPYR